MNKKAADHIGVDRVGAGVEFDGTLSGGQVMGPLVGALAIANFSLWSLRGRAGQLVPVALAFLLLVAPCRQLAHCMISLVPRHSRK